jgi:hypothetical protein
LLALAIGRATVPTDKKNQDRQAKQIVGGLAAMRSLIDDLTEQMIGDSGLPQFYFLWTVERVATLYNLQAFGDKDWYRWGAQILVSSQTTGGEWPFVPGDITGGSYGNVLNTSFALLFLKRSNMTKDLTTKLPFKPGELNKGIMALRAGPSPATSSSPGESNTKQRSSTPPR